MKIFKPDEKDYIAARISTVFTRLTRGLLRIDGVDRLDLIHRLSTNAVLDLKPGNETTTIFTTEKGRIEEVVRVLAFEEHLILVLTGETTSGLATWLDKYTIMEDFTTSDITGNYTTLGIYGDNARHVVEQLTGTEVADAGAFTVSNSLSGIIVIREARLNGSGSFLLLVPANLTEQVLGELTGQGIEEVGMDTWHTFRVEVGRPAMGMEMTEKYNPLEAGLVQYISFTKGCYIGQEVIARLDTYDKVQRHLVGLILNAEPENGADELKVYEPNEERIIGDITSLSYSPGIGRWVALAYIRSQYAIPGFDVNVIEGDETSHLAVTATITKLPFPQPEGQE